MSDTSGQSQGATPQKAKVLGIVVVVAAVLLVAALGLGYAFSSGMFSGSSSSSQPQGPISVAVSVSSDEADGQVSASKTVELDGGANAYDALEALGLELNTRTTSYGVYVAGIEGLDEKEYGGASGWTYMVNGESPMFAATEYILEDGDTVEWAYVKDGSM